MVYQFLARLFSSNYLDRYTPHPFHLLWALFIMAIGVVTFTKSGWTLFGVVTFSLGASVGVATVIGMMWEKSIEYWRTLDQFATTMMRSNNPDLWQALGFKHPPEQVMITEVIPETKEHGWQTKIHRVPVSPAVMQSIADKVLHSGNTDFIEADYSNIPNIRKVRNQLKAEGFLSPKNKKNVRLGYTFNRKGVNALYEYASEGVKLELKRKKE